MATKRHTKAEKQVADDMLALVEWASEPPDEWHPIGRLASTKKAAELLAERGVIEIWKEKNMYRIKRAVRK